MRSHTLLLLVAGAKVKEFELPSLTKVNEYSPERINVNCA